MEWWGNSFAFESASTTSLLLHGDVSPLIDSSPNTKSISTTGSVAYSTAQKKYGSGSIYFNNSAGNRLTTPSNAAFAFGTGDFTVEAWVYLLGQNQYSSLLEIGSHNSASSNGILFLVGSDIAGGVYSGAWLGGRMTSLLNQWQHLAYCRSQGVLRGFRNGSQVFSTAFTNNLTDTSQVTVGLAPAGGGTTLAYALNGYVDDLRIKKAEAVYTANFSPPSAPFPDL